MPAMNAATGFVIFSLMYAAPRDEAPLISPIETPANGPSKVSLRFLCSWARFFGGQLSRDLRIAAGRDLAESLPWCDPNLTFDSAG